MKINNHMPNIAATLRPEITPFPRFSLPTPEYETLGNGTSLTTLSRGDQEVCCLTVSFPRGTANLATDSVFKLLQSMLPEGTAHLSGEDIANRLDFHGAWLRTDIGNHYTDVKLYALNSTFERLLPLMRDILDNATFPAEAFERQKQREIAAATTAFQKVSVLADNKLKQLIYGEDNPLLKGEISPETLQNISRTDLINAYNAIFKSCRSELTLSGLISNQPADINKSLELDSMKLAESVASCYQPMSSAPVGRYNVNAEGSLQAAISSGIPTISRDHDDYCRLRIAVMALGGYFGSRLMKSVREELGLTYGISASLVGQPEGAYISIKCQTTPTNVVQVIEEINRQIDLLASKPMEADELNQLKATAMSSLMAVLDSPFSILDYIVNLKRLHAPDDYFNQQQEAIASLTPDDIMRLTEAYIVPAKALTVVAG